jgi:hypothetical protein
VVPTSCCCSAATVVQFPRDAQIIRKGEAGEVFYIIENGSVVCKNLRCVCVCAALCDRVPSRVFLLAGR